VHHGKETETKNHREEQTMAKMKTISTEKLQRRLEQGHSLISGTANGRYFNRQLF
jgi:hypothetical protein